MICPACGAEARRSHSRGLREKLFKVTSGYRIYRCKSCQWRGWLTQGRLVSRATTVRTYLYFIIVLIVTVMLALYYAGRLAETGSAFSSP